jgi:RNA polymerase sigma factor (sigma-70 family)
MTETTGVSLFEQCRAMLMGLAYRMLGSWADAEDAVQDTFVKWQNADQAAIDNPAGWLTTICTRRCIDLLRSAHRTRVEYVGTWLPEPIQTPIVDLADTSDGLAPSLATAFLLMLERLTPKERAAYLLYEIFEVSYADIAHILAIQESACRKLVSRARQNIEHAKVRHVTPVERQEQLLAAFQAAVTSGNVGPLATMLSDEIELCADGGGKVATSSRHSTAGSQWSGSSRGSCTSTGRASTGCPRTSTAIADTSCAVAARQTPRSRLPSTPPDTRRTSTSSGTLISCRVWLRPHRR